MKLGRTQVISIKINRGQVGTLWIVSVTKKHMLTISCTSTDNTSYLLNTYPCKERVRANTGQDVFFAKKLFFFFVAPSRNKTLPKTGILFIFSNSRLALSTQSDATAYGTGIVFTI